jgi:hypothetical protein
MKYYSLAIAVVWLLMLPSCRKLGLCHDAELSHKVAYTGTELRTDGYYYMDYDAGNGTTRQTVEILYKNGVIMRPGSTDSSDELIQQFLDEKVSGIEKVRYSWGVFFINGTEITIENWPPTFMGCSPKELTTGQILNDTTFVLTKQVTKNNKGKVQREWTMNETYHFRKLTVKPDSTNEIVGN